MVFFTPQLFRSREAATERDRRDYYVDEREIPDRDRLEFYEPEGPRDVRERDVRVYRDTREPRDYRDLRDTTRYQREPSSTRREREYMDERDDQRMRDYRFLHFLTVKLGGKVERALGGKRLSRSLICKQD